MELNHYKQCKMLNINLDIKHITCRMNKQMKRIKNAVKLQNKKIN